MCAMMSHVHVGQSDRMQLEEKKRKEERKNVRDQSMRVGINMFSRQKDVPMKYNLFTIEPL